LRERILFRLEAGRSLLERRECLRSRAFQIKGAGENEGESEEDEAAELKLEEPEDELEALEAVPDGTVPEIVYCPTSP